MKGSTQPRRLLDGIRVLDFTRFLAGPYLTRALGVMGADVIKIERPPHGDEQRGHPYFIQGASGYFLQQNHDKRGLCMDLKRPEAQVVAQNLAAASDILVENFRPGVMSRMGLDYPTLSALNPRLVYCSISSFGQHGPYAQRPGYGIIADALSGTLHITGFPDRPPPIIRMPVADTLTRIHGVAAVCAALYAREKTGEGQHIDIALLDCMFALHEYAIQEFLLSGGEVEATRVGSGLPGSVPYGVFAGRDGCLVLGAPSDTQWAQVCQAMGRPELEADPRYATNADRARHHAEVYKLVQDWVMSCPSVAETLRRLEAAGVPCARVQTIREAAEDPQIAARGMIVELEHPQAGKVRLPNLPFRFSKADTSPNGASHWAATHVIEGKVALPELGYPCQVDRIATVGKGILTAKMQDYIGTFHTLRLCRFLIRIGAKPVLDWYRHVTGREVDLEELLRVGARMSNLKRLFNVRCGIRRKDDILPPRLLKEPQPKGGAAGYLPDLENMLAEYYDYRRWDADGVPRPETLERLGLSREVADLPCSGGQGSGQE